MSPGMIVQFMGHYGVHVTEDDVVQAVDAFFPLESGKKMFDLCRRDLEILMEVLSKHLLF